MTEILAITSAWLRKLHPMLARSFGEAVDIEDEIAYFVSEQPCAWFVATREGEPVGFIRHFPIQAGESRGEIFLSEQRKSDEVAFALTKRFVADYDAPVRTRVTFLFPPVQAPWISPCTTGGLNDGLECFYAFLYRPNTGTVSACPPSVRRAHRPDLPVIRDVLADLVERSREEILCSIDEGRVVVALEGERVVGAAECQIATARLEVVTLAVARDRRGRGHGTMLLRGTVALFQVGYSRKEVFALTRDGNEPAQRMNERVGFVREPAEDRTCLYAFLPRP